MASPLDDAWKGQVECTDHIECVQLSRDGRLVCLGSAGGEIAVVEVESGRVAARLSGHEGGTLALCCVPDGRVASGGGDSFVRVHSLESMGEVGRMCVQGAAGINSPTGTWVTAIAADPRRARVAAAAGRTIHVADLDSGAFCGDGRGAAGCVCVLDSLARAVDCVAFLADGTLSACGFGGVTLFRECAPATAQDGGQCVRYEAVARFAKTYHTGAEGATLGYQGWLLSLAPAPGGEWLACGCSDNTVRLWRVASGQDFKCGGYSSKVSCVVWDPAGRFCATSGSNQATLWDFASGSPAGSTPMACVGQKAAVTALAFHPRGRYVASGSADGVLKVYDTHAFEPGDMRAGVPHTCHALGSARVSAAAGGLPLGIEHLAWSATGVLVAACAMGRCTALRFAL